jgi:glycosyltransferase involved in cell wall biosynthesis
MNNVRLRILFFASWYPNKYSNVLGVFVQNKLKAVASLCDVALIYVTKDPSAGNVFDVESAVEDSIPMVRVYFRTSSNPFLDKLLYNIRFLQAYLIAWKMVKQQWGIPDLIHVNVADRAGLPALILRCLRRIPYVITEHSTPDVAFAKGERAKPLFPRRSLKHFIWRYSEGGSVDSTISLKFIQAMNITKNIVVIPNVVTVGPEQLHEAMTPSLLEKRIGLHISNLIERKNVRDIVRATATLAASRSDFEIHIVGTGEQRDELIALARELDVLNRHVFFHGYVSDEKKSELIAHSDFHILNSDEEGFSVAAAESLCYGIPVLTTDCGGPEDFVNETNGITIKRRNLKELISGINTMVDRARTYDRTAISKEARNRFAPDVVARETLEMYRAAKIQWPAGNTKMQIPIDQEALVLDVGSGHQPHRRANVLLERYPGETIHRTTQKIVVPQEKAFVVGDGHAMPFREKAFGYIIASHIAEHVDDPTRFCREMSRVGKAGYIETPGPLTEYLMPTPSHKWIVSRHGQTLVFRKNNVQRSIFPFFFRFFYLNRDGYVKATWNTSNKILILANTALLKLWAHMPYAYTRVVWNGKVEGFVERE